PPRAPRLVPLAGRHYSSLGPTDAPTLVKVTYASVGSAAPFELVRVRCGSQPSTVEVASSLAAKPTVKCRNAAGVVMPDCTGAGDDVPAIVELSLQALDAGGHDPTTYDATLAGQRR